MTTGEAPVYQIELVLSEGGIGSRQFGAAPDDVVKYVSSLLGAPTDDTDWVDATEHPACPGTTVRLVEWGVLSLQFSDDTSIKSEGEHFFGWTYGDPAEIGQSPEGMHTAQGIGPGSSVAEVEAAYADTGFSEGDPDTAFPESFFVPGKFWGLLTTQAADGIVTQISSELGCGE